MSKTKNKKRSSNKKTKKRSQPTRKIQTRSKTRRRVYSKSQYNSGDGMLTGVWGPSIWHYLHTMSFNYPVNPTKEDKKYYKESILSLRYTLPCKYCRENLKNNLKDLPITDSVMKNRDSFSRYVYKLHEHINKMLNKKSGLSYNDVRERYEHFRSRCTIDEDKFNIFKYNKKKEKGCVTPMYGKKSKCVIKIVPQNEKCKTFQIDKKCVKRNL